MYIEHNKKYIFNVIKGRVVFEGYLYNNCSIYTLCYISYLSSVILHIRDKTSPKLRFKLTYVSWYVYNPTRYKSRLF